MHILAHFTFPEAIVLAGTFLLGVVSGVALAWFVGARWLFRGR